MRQRVTIIMSTLLNPSLLIADEVTSALDVSTQRAVGEMLIEFRDRGYVKSVHRDHPRPVDPGPDRRQHPGHVRRPAGGEGQHRRRLVNSPLHPYTQMLLASLPEVGVRHDQVTLTGIPGRPPSLAEPAVRLPLPPSAARSRSRSAPRPRRSRRSSPVTWSPAGRSARSTRTWPGRTGTAPEGAGMTTLKLDQVSKLYRASAGGGGLTPALRKVSFEHRPGEVVTLIGESGSGKTTLGKILLRLTPASSGHGDVRRHRTSRPSPGAACATTTGTCRASSRTRSAPTTPSTRPTGSSTWSAASYFPKCQRRSGRPRSSPRSTRSRSTRRRARQVPAPAVRRPAAAAADRPRPAARRQAARRRRDHQHARRVHPRRHPEPARQPEAVRAWRSCSSPTTCRSATTSATGRSSCGTARSWRWARRRRSSATRSTPTRRSC